MTSDLTNLSVITISGQTAQIKTLDMGSVGIQITGTWTGTLVAEVSVDGQTWTANNIVPVPATTPVASITSNGAWQTNCSGFRFFRLRASTAVTGSAVVSLQSTPTVATLAVSLTGSSGGVLGTVKIEDTNGATIAVGQTTMASSLPVTIASNQSSIPVAGTAAAGVAASGNPVQVGAVYNSTAPSPATGQIEPLQSDSLGNLQSNMYTAIAGEDLTNNVLALAIKPLSVSTYTPTVYSNFAGAVTGAPIKASAGNLFTIVATNANAAVRYLQLHNLTAKPAGGAVPIAVFPIPVANGTLQLGDQAFSLMGINFATGITWAVSTTIGTFTDAATAAEHTIFSTYA